MKVLLIKDVYKLGHAGDVKKVANGYGRNYLIPQSLAVLATPAALKEVERIRNQADVARAAMNQEMSGEAEKLAQLVLAYPAKASETGKLYGSISPQMIADTINQKLALELTRRQIDVQPIRTLGTHSVHVRLTVDLVPEVTVIVHREGESPTLADVKEEATPVAQPAPVEMEAEPEGESD